MRRSAILAGVLGFWTFVLLSIGICCCFFSLALLPVLFPTWFWKSSVRGIVLDPAGEPVAGARVSAEYFGDRSDSPIPGSRSPAVSDASGAFLVENVIPGTVALLARSEGVAPNAPVWLELEDEQEVEGLVLGLRIPGRIAGEFVGHLDRPGCGREVLVWMEGCILGEAEIDAFGAFVVEGLRVEELSDSEWFLTATAGELQAAWVRTRCPPSEPWTIELRLAPRTQ